MDIRQAITDKIIAMLEKGGNVAFHATARPATHTRASTC